MDDLRSARTAKLRRLLRAIRRERGITQVELARRLGVPQSVVSKFESGERQLGFVEVLEVLDAVGMSLRSLCRRWEGPGSDVAD